MRFFTTGIGVALLATQLRGGSARFGLACAIALAGAFFVVMDASAELTGADPHQAGASNGGIATTTAGGDVTIDQIITGENTGNSIVTGDISGPADIRGGDISYPTEVNVSLDIGPQAADASGGDGGEAVATPGDENAPDIDVDVVNRNTNRNEANSGS